MLEPWLGLRAYTEGTLEPDVTEHDGYQVSWTYASGQHALGSRLDIHYVVDHVFGVEHRIGLQAADLEVWFGPEARRPSALPGAKR